ncbi:ribosome silencing factor [Candidatus Riflebacteria bacterium]
MGYPLSGEDLLKVIIDNLIDKKGLNILHIDLKGRVDYTDAFIVVSGSSKIHVQAMTEYLRLMLKDKYGILPGCVEGFESGNWVIMDYSEIVIHFFDSYTREYYDLESLWIDSPRTEYYLDNQGSLVSRLKP